MCKECLEHAIPEDLSTSRPQQVPPLSDADLLALLEARREEMDALMKKLVPPYTPEDIDPLGR